MATDRQTNLQTDAPSLNSYFDVQMPTADEEKEIAQRWEAKWAFPQAYGAIYLR